MSLLMRSGAASWATPRPKLKRPRNLASMRSGGCLVMTPRYPYALGATTHVETGANSGLFLGMGLDLGGRAAPPSRRGSDHPAASPAPAQAFQTAAIPSEAEGPRRPRSRLDQRRRGRRPRPPLRAPGPLVRLAALSSA